MECIKCQGEAHKVSTDFYGLYCGKSKCEADMKVEAPKTTAPATLSEWVEFYRNRGEDYGTSYAWAREAVDNEIVGVA